MPELQDGSIFKALSESKGDVASMHKMSLISCHGLPYVLSAEKTCTERILWLLATLLSLLILVVCLVEIGMAYKTYPVKFSTSITNEQTMPFPAVTICSLSEFDSRGAADLPNLQNVSQKLSALFADEGLSRMNLKNLLLDSNYSDILDLTKYQVFEALSPKVESLLVYCAFDNKPHLCIEKFKAMRENRHCFQFNSDMAHGLQETLVGPHAGLRVILKVDTAGHIPSRLFSMGAKVILHEVGTFANVDVTGTLLRPGTTTFLSLHLTDTKSLPYPYKPNGDHYCAKDTGAGYSRPGCFHNCVAKIISKRCGCSAVPVDIDAGGGKGVSSLPNCTLRDYLKCYRPKFDEILSTIHLSLADNNCVISCPDNCDMIEYTATASYADFKSELAKDYLDPSYSYIELRIFFEELVKKKISYGPYYTTEVLLGSLGGHMGFFLGASLLTFIEIFEMVCFVFAWLFLTRRRDREPQKHGTEEVAEITKS